MDNPKDFETRMKNMLGGEYTAFKSSMDTAPIYSGMRINTLRAGASAAVIDAFGELENVPWCSDGFYIDKGIVSGKHPLHIAGVFYFQEPSAMCAVEGLPIEPGDFVLDLCAAPGGKSTQAAAKLCGKGVIVANEIIKSRAEILSGNIERMGITNAIVTNEQPERLAEKYPDFFDKIVVDAPCSGEGMFRKEPQAMTHWSIEHTVSCGMRQKNILSSALKMLKPGGMLVYSTCTFAPEENEIIAAWLLDNGMELCDMPSLSALSPGRTEWSKSYYDMSKTRRIFCHLHKGEGHFASLFRKPYYDIEMPKKKKIRVRADNAALLQAIEQYRNFEKNFLNVNLQGEFVLFGDNLYLKPAGINIDGIKVLRCGLWLGTLKKNRFEPSHSLALALNKNDFKNTVTFNCNDERLLKYLAGEVIESNKSGWCVVCAEGFNVGLGKCSGGILKNHFPKGLRIVL